MCSFDVVNRTSLEMGKEPSLLKFGSVWVLVKYLTTGFGSGSVTTRVRFGSKMSVFLHCKIAYTTEENVCFALLTRITYWNHIMSSLLQSSPLILYKSCLPVHATHITSNVMLNYQYRADNALKTRDGKEPSLLGFGAVRVLFIFPASEF